MNFAWQVILQTCWEPGHGEERDLMVRIRGLRLGARESREQGFDPSDSGFRTVSKPAIICEGTT